MVRSFLRPAQYTAILLLCLVTAGGCALRSGREATAPAPAPGEFFPASGVPQTLAGVAAMAARADYVLIGERHDSALDHKVQAALIEAVARRGKTPAIGLEMLPRNRYDAVLADFTASRLPLAELPAAVDWKGNWGFDFALYEPIFAAALEYRIPVYGLNLPHDVRTAVSRKGLEGITAAERNELPARIIPPLLVQRERLSNFFVSHSHMRAQGQAVRDGAPAASGSPANGRRSPAPAVPVPVPAQRNGEKITIALPVSLRAPFERFLLIQSLWDNTMAEQAYRLRRERLQTDPEAGPMIIPAGGGHVEYGYGIAARLGVLDPAANILIIMPADGKPDPKAGDLFYSSPRPENRARYGLTFVRNKDAVGIAAVEPGSRADKAGLRAGDRIAQAGKTPIADLRAFHTAATTALRENKELVLLVERNGAALRITLPTAD